MNKRSSRKLSLRKEALLVLAPSALGVVRGGSLVTETDPATAPQPDTDKGGTLQPYYRTRTCLG